MRVEKLGSAVAAVAVDELLTYLKETGKLTGPAAMAQDAYRIAGCIGAIAYETFMARTGMEKEVAEGFGLALLSPAVQSIIKLVKGALAYTPRVVVVSSPTTPAPAAAPASASRLTGW